jgi:hypothetical protein
MITLEVVRTSADCKKSRTIERASALRASTTESSRSIEIASAWLASALANNSGREPGTNSLLRMSFSIKYLKFVGIEWKKKRREGIFKQHYLLLPR